MTVAGIINEKECQVRGSTTMYCLFKQFVIFIIFQLRCQNEEGCIVFTFETSSQNCFLKNSEAGSSFATGKISGRSLCDNDCIYYSTNYQVDNNHQSVTLDVPSIDECRDICKSLSGCKGFVWKMGSASNFANRCLTKTTTGPIVPSWPPLVTGLLEC